MTTRLLLCLLAAGLFVAPASGQETDAKKSDADTVVKAGTEFTLTPVEVTVADRPTDFGFFSATVKPAGDAKTVKMPAESWYFGFVPRKSGDAGVEIGSVPESDTGLVGMRSEAGGEDGQWRADAGDVITHVNGYAVKSVEDIICAASVAENKKDIQIVIKEVNSGMTAILYVTAIKK